MSDPYAELIVAALINTFVYGLEDNLSFIEDDGHKILNYLHTQGYVLVKQSYIDDLYDRAWDGDKGWSLHK